MIELSVKANESHVPLCSELWLAGLKAYANTSGCKVALWRVSQQLAPVLARGFVESRSDIHGRAYYIVSDAGREAATLPPPIMPSLPEYNDTANELYHAETLAARERLRTAPPANPSEIGFCPLPCSLNLQHPRTRKKQ